VRGLIVLSVHYRRPRLRLVLPRRLVIPAGVLSNRRRGDPVNDECPLWIKSRHLQRKSACPPYPRKRHQMRHMQCPLLAQSGHRLLHCTCPLLGRKQTSLGNRQMSANDPKRTSSINSLLVSLPIEGELLRSCNDPRSAYPLSGSNYLLRGAVSCVPRRFGR
jgi:hypothetical protein